MRAIEPLPLPLRNSIRSGIIVYDLTRVVEELLFNSLDASATEVSVFLGVETGSVKVVDNGCGISRDGLVLLGERYVTSKLCSDTFGFRGETLASISNVSSLEIVTRTCGRPNGYRKVIKGSKCLYFGIDDNRKDVGTTVSVRDLFYNQPVRKKFCQTSATKVLQSVKSCVLRVALVHSKVSFKIIDIESGNELLSTYCSSAMSILIGDYGIDGFNSLHKLNVMDGFLSLSGYITGPSDDFSAKAFQYVYINSRYVIKGPIHQLLNHLAMTFEGLDSSSAMSGKGKRGRVQACIAYIVNLYCPRDLYDLTFEPSKTSAEFKDWGPILTFIQKAVQEVWSKIVHGESSSHIADLDTELWKGNDDVTSIKEILPKTSEVAMDKFKRQQCGLAYPLLERLKKRPDETFHGDCNGATCLEFEVAASELKDQQVGTEFLCQSFDFPDDILEDGHNKGQTYSDDMEVDHQSSLWLNSSPKIESAKMEIPPDHDAWRKLEVSESGKNRYRNDGDSTLHEFEGDVSGFKEDVGMRFVCQSDFSMQPMNVSYTERIPMMAQERYSPLFTARSSFEFPDDKPLEDRRNVRQKYIDEMGGNHPASDWQDEYPKDESAYIYLSSEHEVWRNKQLKFSGSGRDRFLNGCSFGRSLSCSKSLLNNQKEAEFPIAELQFPDDRFLEDRHSARQNYSDDIERSLLSSEWQNEYPKDETANIVSSSDHEVWSKHLKVGETGEGHFLPSFSLTRSLSCSKGLKCSGEETEFSIAEPQYKRKRFCFQENMDALQNESNDKRDDIFTGQGEQTFAEGRRLQSDFAVHMGSILSGSRFLRSDPDSETNSALLQACWGVDNCPRDTTDEVSGRSYEKEKSHCHRVGSMAEETNLLSLHRPHMTRNNANWLQFDLQFEGQNSCGKHRDRRDKPGYRIGRKNRSDYFRRSHSAPPFSRQRKKFASLHGSLSSGRKPHAQVVHNRGNTLTDGSLVKSCILAEKNKITDLEQNSIKDFGPTTRPEMKHEQSTVSEIDDVLEGNKVEHECTEAHNSLGFTSSGSRAFEEFGSKWRNGSQENKTARDGDSHHSTLLSTSGFSCLTDSMLIPESLHKNCLKEAKVLQQVDKKFIPVVAGGTLSLIDQHAADERIRLEELQGKVLSGKARTISYLDAEQELVLPEFGYQLLHDYADQVRDWGWVCNMRSQGSEIFNKNFNVLHQQRAMMTLIAVPSVLGVNLSGGDLLEYLHQLADTDGASTVPPCVVRVLNLKACRGAIMFGDSLLPSECALIVEELDKTQLCFQCAHGRPTTIPLVNLAALHGEIAKLGLFTKKNGFVLERQEIGICRAAQRLAATEGA